MAKTPAPSASRPAKQPGRLRQLAQIFSMTVKHDRTALPILLACLIVPIVIAVVIALLLTGNPWLIVAWGVAGLMVGVLLMMVALGRLAERMAYRRIEGQPGAVGMVLSSSLRGWRSSEMPVAVNPRTQDAVYRAVGRPGIVLVAEGNATRNRKQIDDEQRRASRIVPNVPIHVLEVNTTDGIPVGKLAATMKKLPKHLTRNEIPAVASRLESLAKPLPIPKGVDPMRVRSQRPR